LIATMQFQNINMCSKTSLRDRVSYFTLVVHSIYVIHYSDITW